MTQAVLSRILSAAMLAAVLALSALPGCGAEGAAPTAGSPAQTRPATPTAVATTTPSGSPAGATQAAAPAATVATAPPTADGRAATTPPNAVTAPSPDGATAFDFRFTLFQGGDLVGGDSLDLSDLQGTPVVLNFWARLCAPCWAEMPELQDFYEEFGTRVHLLGIDIGKFTGLGFAQGLQRPARLSRHHLSGRIHRRGRGGPSVRGAGHAHHGFHNGRREGLPYMDGGTGPAGSDGNHRGDAERGNALEPPN